MEKACVRITISGSVQGVGFRYAAHKAAILHSIDGYVQNQYDGTVLIVAEAEETNLNNFVRWCYNGPSHARVTKVDIQHEPLQHFASFSIKY